MHSGPVSGAAELIIGTGLVGYWVWSVFESIEATRWPRAQGRIIRTDVEEVPARFTPDWAPKVTYSYEVDGTTHTGTRISFYDYDNATSRSKAEAQLNRFPVGSSVTVRYHPANPSRSVLELGFRLGPLVVVAVAVALILFGLSSLGLF